MKEEDFDAILVLENNICEDQEYYLDKAAPDPRSVQYGTVNGIYYGNKYLQLDPFLKTPISFGNTIQRHLNSMGDGFSCKVDDFGGSVVVSVTYNNTATARSAQKTFLIRFNNKSGDGIVMSSSAKYRTITGINQAESYIRSASQSLKNQTQQQL